MNFQVLRKIKQKYFAGGFLTIITVILFGNCTFPPKRMAYARIGGIEIGTEKIRAEKLIKNHFGVDKLIYQGDSIFGYSGACYHENFYVKVRDNKVIGIIYQCDNIPEDSIDVVGNGHRYHKLESFKYENNEIAFNYDGLGTFRIFKK